MTNYLFAGGGTAGHVNPMLAIADAIKDSDPSAHIMCIGTREGLESTLVPQRGYELVTIARLPFPRLRNLIPAGFKFVRGWPQAVKTIRDEIRQRNIDIVIGVGGYASAPAYQAASQEGVPFVIHEANAKPGLANKWGARKTPFVGVTFPGTPLPHAVTVGTPLRKEIEQLDIPHTQIQARQHFGLESNRPVLLITSGSQGAKSINETVARSTLEIIANGYQILHILGQNKPESIPQTDHYVALDYCDRMDLALAAATLVISRAGSATVSELSALGIPAVYVPYPVGNGEQRLNAAPVVKAGGGILVEDKDFTPEWIHANLIPLLRDEQKIDSMGKAAAKVGIRNGTDLMVNLINDALS